MFLRDIEEDEDLRQTVNLYKGPTNAGTHGDVDMGDETETEDEDEDFPTIQVEDLLDGFDSMRIAEVEEDEEDE